MKDVFSLNSPWMQRFAMLTNLVVLNFLWLACCLPVFTAGAATAAARPSTKRVRSNTDRRSTCPTRGGR